jgi:hypothetical protein
MMDGHFSQCMSWESRFERLDLTHYHFTWANSLWIHRFLKGWRSNKKHLWRHLLFRAAQSKTVSKNGSQNESSLEMHL